MSDFNETLNFLNSLSKNTQISTFNKIRPMGDELVLADKRKDGHEANSRFPQFCERT
jgi:hypothetical protein